MPGLADDEEGARIVGEELKLLATVHRALEQATGADVSAARGRAEDEERMLELRDHVAVAKPEDLPALFEQMHHLGALRAQRGRSISGSVDRTSPYFGHMRLEEQVPGSDGERPGKSKGSTRRRDVLIGSRSYVDSGEGIRIVDWRHAPVSRIYYRYLEGDDYEEQLGDRMVEGSVVARRGISIAQGQLVRVSAPQGTFVRGADGLWKRVAVHGARLETEQKWSARQGIASEARLGIGVDGQRRQDKHLPAIAALLDPQQFALIARPAGDSKAGDGLVAIQGSAGSGKTTVGLHRVAYLAFQEPQRFRPEKMFVVVPNEALVHYVSRVLPSLGVEGVPVTTFARFASRLTSQLFPRLPTRISEETPPIVSRAKSHAAMIRAIERTVGRIAESVDKKMRAAMAKWPQGETVVAAWHATEREGNALPPDARVSLLAQWLSGKRTLAQTPAATGLPNVTRSALEPLIAELRSQTRAVAALWDEVLTSRESLATTFASEPGFAPAQLDQVHEWCVRQTRLRSEGERDGEEPAIDSEDPALLLRCWQVLRGPLVDPEAKPIRFAHMFVDEVQDASPVELRVLLDLTGADRSITLAGDIAQRMLDDNDGRGEFDWNALLDDLGVPHTQIEPLRVSYRSTAEITEFARTILGPLAHDEVPETSRHGPPVELFRFASPGESVAWLAEVLKDLAREEPDANVALITRFPQQADLYFEGLARAEVSGVRRVAKQDFSWEPGVDVTDVRQTKGLEFDEVILLETSAASYPVAPAARHALYVGATRASHQLWCVTSDRPSELVTAALPDSGDNQP
ncbi:MAG TPA: ATP-binding domain-containing protein [Polyangiaceae bacterium]|nr:ATP-binding domain-containing protein [Polyangiaceae bacterium]